jgi:uncharacterized protein
MGCHRYNRAPMRDQRPPERLAPHKFASQNAVFSGVWPLAHFDRLRPSLTSEDGEVKCELRGELDGMRRPLLIAHVQAELQLQCQTCLQPMSHHVDREFTLCVVKDDDEADELSEDVEPLILEDDSEEIALRDVFEDELILSLPVVANHEPGTCGVAVPALQSAQDVMTNEKFDAPAKDNPFAVLAGLKKTGK